MPTRQAQVVKLRIDGGTARADSEESLTQIDGTG